MNAGQPQPGDPKANFRVLQILFWALVAGLVIFSLVATGLHLTGSFVAPNIEEPGISIVVALAIAGICLIVAWRGYKTAIGIAKNLTGSLNDKLIYYRSLLIKYLALCDFAAIFSVIAFFLTGDFRLFIITAIMLVAMLSVMPSKKRLIENLGLDWNEQTQL